MLPAFRVRQVRAVDKNGRILDGPAGSIQSLKTKEVDGVITISKEEYDRLLKDTPEAALKYVDIDDGDIIQVGSSFELDQRLQEPPDSGISVVLPGSLHRVPEHCFTVQRSKEVVELWRQLDLKNLAKPSKSPNLASILNPQPDPREEYFRSTNPPQLGKETFTPRALEKGKGKALVTPSKQSSGEHEKRWASYSTLPASFDQPSPPPPLKAVEEKKTEAAPVNAGTTERENPQSEPKAESKEAPYQPLLDMFEAELSKLVKSSPALVPSPKTPNDAETVTAAEPDTVPNQGAEETGTSSEDPQGVPSPSSINTPGELLAHSLKSLLSGVSMLASSLKVTNAEIQNQIAIAQQEFPNNLEKAIKAGLQALENLRNAIPVAQSPPIGSHSDGNATENQEEPVGTEAIQLESNVELDASEQNSKDAGAPCSDSPPTASADAFSSKPPDYEAKQSTATIFEAERIISRRWIYYGGLDGPLYKQYLVRWADKGPEHDTWYDTENLTDCWALIEEYEREYPESKRSSEGRAKGTYIGFSPERLAFGSKCEAIHSRTAGNRMVTHGGSHLPAMPPLNQVPPYFATSLNRPRNRQAQILANKRSEPILGDLRHTRARNIPNIVRQNMAPDYIPPPPMFGEQRPGPNPTFDENLSEPRYYLRRRHVPGAFTESQSDDTDKEQNQAATHTLQDSTPPVNKPPRRLRHRQSWHPTSTSTKNERDTGLLSVGPVPVPGTSETNPPPMTQLRGWQFSNRRMAKSMRVPPSTYAPTLWQTSSFGDLPMRSQSTRSATADNTEKSGTKINTGEKASTAKVTFDEVPTTINSSAPSAWNWSQWSGPGSALNAKRGPEVEGITHKQTLPTSSGSQKAKRMVPFLERKNYCVQKLIEMGFGRADAETASSCSGGDLDKALEMIEEDRAAWSAARTAWTSAQKDRESKDPIPGSWDDELYG